MVSNPDYLVCLVKCWRYSTNSSCVIHPAWLMNHSEWLTRRIIMKVSPHVFAWKYECRRNTVSYSVHSAVYSYCSSPLCTCHLTWLVVVHLTTWATLFAPLSASTLSNIVNIVYSWRCKLMFLQFSKQTIFFTWEFHCFVYDFVINVLKPCILEAKSFLVLSLIFHCFFLRNQRASQTRQSLCFCQSCEGFHCIQQTRMPTV